MGQMTYQKNVPKQDQQLVSITHMNHLLIRVASDPMVKLLFSYNTQLNNSKLVFYVILCLQVSQICNYLYKVSNQEYKMGNSRQHCLMIQVFSPVNWKNRTTQNILSVRASEQHNAIILVMDMPLFQLCFFFLFSRQNRILSRKQILTYIGRVGPKGTDYSA